MRVSDTLMYKNQTWSRIQRFSPGKLGDCFVQPPGHRDTPVLEPAMRMNPPSIKYNAAKNHKPSEVVLKAGKENRKLYAMLKNDDPDRTPEERDSMWRGGNEDRGRREDGLMAIVERCVDRFRKRRRNDLGKSSLLRWGWGWKLLVEWLANTSRFQHQPVQLNG
jgi:hypothetical protein